MAAGIRDEARMTGTEAGSRWMAAIVRSERARWLSSNVPSISEQRALNFIRINKYAISRVRKVTFVSLCCLSHRPHENIFLCDRSMTPGLKTHRLTQKMLPFL